MVAKLRKMQSKALRSKDPIAGVLKKPASQEPECFFLLYTLLARKHESPQLSRLTVAINTTTLFINICCN